MARPIMCDTCGAAEAVLMVSVLANGTTVAVCGEHAPALLSTLGGTGAPDECQICKEEPARFTWTDHETGDSLSSGQQCVVPYVAGLAESVGLVVTLPQESDEAEAVAEATTGDDGGDEPGTADESAPRRTGRGNRSRRAANAPTGGTQGEALDDHESDSVAPPE